MDLPWDDEAEATKFHRLDLVEGTDDSRECESPATAFTLHWSKAHTYI